MELGDSGGGVLQDMKVKDDSNQSGSQTKPTCCVQVVPVLEKSLVVVVIVIFRYGGGRFVTGGIMKGVVHVSFRRVRTSQASQSFAANLLHNILVRLRFVRLVIFWKSRIFATFVQFM